MFKAAHRSAPEIAGKHFVNPTALMFSVILMLMHLGQDAVPRRMEEVIHRVYRHDRRLTRVEGGTATPEEFTSAVTAALS